MTAEEKLIQVRVEIDNLKKDLEDFKLLERYYSGTDPNEKDELKGKIKAKERISKIIKILDL
ncbi:MAG: hypothetical protein ACOYOR_05000 [Flavobacterium psychrophilum]